ncbi:MAG TPA: aryl-sulfate sulfotransferase [Candidatus Kapabacteria bacterium]|nr:aryl-sulfate sulfotransferase [Candidatus Kapabacteria bacterium]
MPGILTILALNQGCNAPVNNNSPAGGVAPVIVSASVQANPVNVVSAVAAVHVTGAATVRVEYGTDSLFGSATGSVNVVGDSATIPIVGLIASTAYRLRVVATGTQGARSQSQPMTFATGALPADIPHYAVRTAGAPSPGYVMCGFTAGDTSLGGFYAVVMNNGGDIVWYRKFRTQVTDFQRQPNGNFTVFASLGQDDRHFYELDRLGNVVNEYRAAEGIETGAHEVRLFEGGYVLFGRRDSVMDLAQYGGRVTMVSGEIVEYHQPGHPVLRWSTFGHLTPDEAAPDIPLNAPRVDPWHLNAIEVDTDHNLLISFRNSDEIVKVDGTTGAIIWRLGGRKNQFTFDADPLNGFSHQHGIRRLANGHLILFDNGNLHQPPESRPVEYRIDETARTAHLVWQYRTAPPLAAVALGFAHRTEDGHTLVCYGTAQHLIEVDAANVEQWRLTVTSPGYFIYRAFRLSSL